MILGFEKIIRQKARFALLFICLSLSGQRKHPLGVARWLAWLIYGACGTPQTLSLGKTPLAWVSFAGDRARAPDDQRTHCCPLAVEPELALLENGATGNFAKQFMPDYSRLSTVLTGCNKFRFNPEGGAEASGKCSTSPCPASTGMRRELCRLA